MVRVRIAEWSAPTRAQRLVILLSSHVVTLMALVLWTVGSPWSATPAISAPATPRAATVVTVGSGYDVRQHDWQSARVEIGSAPSAVLILPGPQR